MNLIGAVVIGRNEGERLRRCLKSLRGQLGCVVYVDSGSTDGSTEMARGLGVEAVDLDLSVPFTMARGRNTGFDRLMQSHPELEFVQFVDGDCEVLSGWIERARQTMDSRLDIAAVCGRRRERLPEASIYNRLCDMEWAGPIGEVRACGGDVMIRASAFAEAGGFTVGMIAGEEAELCLRLRAKGWKVLRLACEMTLHDAAILNFGQWWRRTVRTGHAYAEGVAMHGRSPEQHNVRQLRSAWFWGALIPLSLIVVLAATVWSSSASLLVLALLGLTLVWLLRIWHGCLRSGFSPRAAFGYTFFMPPAKLAHCFGAAKYWLDRLRGRSPQLIEYKSAETAQAT